MDARDRIRFRVRTQDGRFEADVRATWRELDAGAAVLLVELRRHDGLVIAIEDAAEACGLSVRGLRLQLRVAAIYADREREREPNRCPLVWLAAGPRREPLQVIEGEVVA